MPQLSKSRTGASAVLMVFTVLLCFMGFSPKVEAQVSAQSTVTCPVFFPAPSSSGGLRVTVNAPAEIQDYTARIDTAKAANFDPPADNQQLVLYSTGGFWEYPVTIEHGGDASSPSWLKVKTGSPVLATAIGANPFTVNRYLSSTSHPDYSRLYFVKRTYEGKLTAHVFVYQLSPAEFIAYAVDLIPSPNTYRTVRFSHHKLILDEIEEFDEIVAVKTGSTKTYTLATLPSGALLADAPAAVRTITVPVWECLDAAVTLYSSSFDNLTGWNLRGAISGDRLNCTGSQAHTGTCAFQFTGGPDENVTLTKTVAYSSIPANFKKLFDSNDALELSAHVKSTGKTSKLKMSLIIDYKIGENKIVSKVVKGQTIDAAYNPFAVSLSIGNRAISKVILRFKHTSQAGKVYVDDVQLALKNIPDAASAANLIPIPLGPTK